ncbi:hypothetical protein RFI_06873 [Reticulomyxa filosa]|uniref:Uncharacterized protein n=1 Tax=Reticulomyxa filosa TaxID=46433 RepID=X6NW77_RETFI|nr:hypothetical protein RFI_06873 [Reticulomyxa filosa]|eukprot:ETO30246.1 hypothetical protein RFI_06873 [Reticulomyxa filosa]
MYNIQKYIAEKLNNNKNENWSHQPWKWEILDVEKIKQAQITNSQSNKKIKLPWSMLCVVFDQTMLDIYRNSILSRKKSLKRITLFFHHSHSFFSATSFILSKNSFHYQLILEKPHEKTFSFLVSLSYVYIEAKKLAPFLTDFSFFCTKRQFDTQEQIKMIIEHNPLLSLKSKNLNICIIRSKPKFLGNSNVNKNGQLLQQNYGNISCGTCVNTLIGLSSKIFSRKFIHYF